MKTKTKLIRELKSRSILTYPTDGGGSGRKCALPSSTLPARLWQWLRPRLGDGVERAAINNDEACAAAPLSPTCELVACFCLHRPASTLAQLRAARRRHTLIFALVRLQNFPR